MIQSRIVDTSSNYGVNGLSFDAIYQHFHGMIPRFGVGTSKDIIFDPTMAELLWSGFPFQTFFIFARPRLCGMSIRDQASRWLDGRGVIVGRAMIDVEPAIYGRNETMVSADELAEAFEFVEHNHPLKPSWYSNGNYVGMLAWPRFLCNYDLLAAQYPWEPWRFREYLNYESFLRDRSGQIPPWVRGTIYQKCVYGWQFTAHGRTPSIAQPVNGWTKKDHDFSVSVIEHADFMTKFFPNAQTPPPEPPGEIIMNFTVITHNLAVRTEPTDTLGNATVIRRMPAGTPFVAIDVHAPRSGGEAWAKNQAGEWACVTKGVDQHMRTD